MDQAEPYPDGGRLDRRHRSSGRKLPELWFPWEETCGSEPARPIPMHPVIAGYDGSVSARNALAYAAGVAKRLGRSLLVVHVVSARPCCDPLTGTLLALPWDPVAAERWLRRELDQLTDVSELDLHAHSRTGLPARELAALAAELNADALVVGAPVGWWRRATSSVPSWLARHAKCPVITVP